MISRAHRPAICYICGADSITAGLYQPTSAMLLTLQVHPGAVMIYGLCADHARPGFSAQVETALLAELTPEGGVQ